MLFRSSRTISPKESGIRNHGVANEKLFVQQSCWITSEERNQYEFLPERFHQFIISDWSKVFSICCLVIYFLVKAPIVKLRLLNEELRLFETKLQAAEEEKQIFKRKAVEERTGLKGCIHCLVHDIAKLKAEWMGSFFCFPTRRI